MGKSGSFNVGFYDSKLTFDTTWTYQYTLTLFLQNKMNHFSWAFTVVYGPTIAANRRIFWEEIRRRWDGPWLIGGDFHSIRARNEKSGTKCQS